MVEQRLSNLRHDTRVERLAQIDARDLGAQCAGDWCDAHRFLDVDMCASAEGIMVESP